VSHLFFSCIVARSCVGKFDKFVYQLKWDKWVGVSKTYHNLAKYHFNQLKILASNNENRIWNYKLVAIT